MSGTYIKCDRCGATLSGAEVSNRPLGLGHGQNHVLREAARKLGWTGEFEYHSTNDLCPKCSSEQQEAPK